MSVDRIAVEQRLSSGSSPVADDQPDNDLDIFTAELFGNVAP